MEGDHVAREKVEARKGTVLAGSKFDNLELVLLQWAHIVKGGHVAREKVETRSEEDAIGLVRLGAERFRTQPGKGLGTCT
jgi:hypothetical protein